MEFLERQEHRQQQSNHLKFRLIAHELMVITDSPAAFF